MTNLNRTNYGPVTPGRERFRQGRVVNSGLATKSNCSNSEAGMLMNTSNTTKESSSHLSQNLNIDKPTYPFKGQMRR